MNYLPNFLSDAAKAVLAQHAMEGKEVYRGSQFIDLEELEFNINRISDL